MNKWIKNIILVMLCTMAYQLYSQCSFEKFFPYSNVESLSIFRTSDNHLIIVADGTPEEIDPINGQKQMVIIKMDTCGNVIWKLIHGDSIQNDLTPADFVETENGDYLFTGTAVFQLNANNIRLLKTNKDGKVLLSYLYPKYNAEASRLVKNAHKKNSYFVGGVNEVKSKSSPYLMETDEDGNIIRDKAFDFPTVKYETKKIRKILQLNNNTMYAFIQLQDSMTVANLDSNFNIRWIKSIAPTQIKRIAFADACFSYDSLSISILGYFTLFNSNNHFTENFIKTDLALNTLNLGGLTDVESFGSYRFIKPTLDNGFNLCNTILDSNLNLIRYDTFYCTDGQAAFFYLVPNGNKSVYGLGMNFYNGAPFSSLFVAKTDQDGRVNIITPKPTLPLKIYPNPAKDILNIEISEEGKTYTVEIIDMLSKTILTQQITGTSTLNIENLTNGFYSVNLTDNTGKVNTCKLFISK
jgi:hypothetical protein